MSGANIPEKRTIPKLKDPICGQMPDQIDEFRELADEEGITPDEFVWREEGTLDRRTGQFLCTRCYLALGQPSVDVRKGRWTATPENLAVFRP